MSPKSTDIVAPKARILIVDDDPIFTAMAEECLTGFDYEVRLATDGVEALQMFDEEKFNLALIDLSMPRIDGFRLIGLIRGAPRFKSMSIMVVSARNDKAAFDEALALGANGYQVKPVDWAEFPARVTELLTAVV